MAKRLEVYKCDACGMMFEVINECSCEPCTVMCCDKPMAVLTENTVDAAKEKHVPVIEQTDEGVKVTVGSVPHPMEEAHYIQWIELLADGKAYLRFLQPGQAPEAVFEGVSGSVCAREYCNLHGLWKA